MWPIPRVWQSESGEFVTIHHQLLVPPMQSGLENHHGPQTTVKLLDDIDGSEAVETIAFAVDGTNYEIDLNQKNADKFRKAVQTFLSNTRTIKPTPALGRPRRAARSVSGPTHPPSRCELLDH